MFLASLTFQQCQQEQDPGLVSALSALNGVDSSHQQYAHLSDVPKHISAEHVTGIDYNGMLSTHHGRMLLDKPIR